MIIILRDTDTPAARRELTVNVNVYDSFSIRKLGEQFQLGLIRYFDGHFSNQSSVFSVIATLQSYKECSDLFNAIMSALEAGDKTFRLSNYNHEADVLILRDNPELPKV